MALERNLDVHRGLEISPCLHRSTRLWLEVASPSLTFLAGKIRLPGKRETKHQEPMHWLAYTAALSLGRDAVGLSL